MMASGGRVGGWVGGWFLVHFIATSWSNLQACKISSRAEIPKLDRVWQYYLLSYAKTRSDQHSLGTSLRIFSRNETRMKAAWVGLSLVYKGANFLIIPPPLIIRNTPRILLCRHCLLPVSLLQVTPPMILYSQVCHILKVKCYVRQGLLRKPSKSP